MRYHIPRSENPSNAPASWLLKNPLVEAHRFYPPMRDGLPGYGEETLLACQSGFHL